MYYTITTLYIVHCVSVCDYVGSVFECYNLQSAWKKKKEKKKNIMDIYRAPSQESPGRLQYKLEKVYMRGCAP